MQFSRATATIFMPHEQQKLSRNQFQHYKKWTTDFIFIKQVYPNVSRLMFFLIFGENQLTLKL